jgi:putative FmdB family regulatory protein
MFKLYDYTCTACSQEFEDLHQEGEPAILCPTCSAPADRNPFSNDPSAIKAQINPARQAEIMMKGAAIKARLQGKLPWRKNSESQSGNN